MRDKSSLTGTLLSPVVMDENVDPALFRFGVATAGYTQCHEALPAGAIRLLVLLPGRYRGDIRCETVDAYLQARPRYEAVSYTWSSSYPSDKLILNGIVLYAGGNLVKCLRRLRRKTVTRTLWVDALCKQYKQLACSRLTVLKPIGADPLLQVSTKQT